MPYRPYPMALSDFGLSSLDDDEVIKSFKAAVGRQSQTPDTKAWRAPYTEGYYDESTYG